MALCLKKIETSVSAMDETYDANFGEWIRNEDNCKIVGSNLKRYVDKYKVSDFITVVKWIVKDWTLKSIILFSKKLIIDGLASRAMDKGSIQNRTSTENLHGESYTDTEEYTRRIKILSGFIYTWNPIFISEFLMASTADFPLEIKAEFYIGILDAFENKKLSDILSQIEEKTDQELKDLLAKKFKDDIYRLTDDKWKRTNSLIDAFNLI